MLDMKFVRENPNIVKENIKKKYQDKKIELVDKVIQLDEVLRETKIKGDNLRQKRNTISDEIGELFKSGNKVKAEEKKEEVNSINEELKVVEEDERKLEEDVRKILMTLPNILREDVPKGIDDSENVQIKTFGEPVIRDYEIPYHIDILESLGGIDLDAARRVSGHGFYYLQGDIARLHSAILSYARDFMINRGFTYCIPPFMIRREIVEGVLSFEEMDAMIYKIEDEDLYLIGTSEHSMIGRYVNQLLEKQELPIKMTSYSPCFRKEKGAHGLEERGIYRVHQFEKQEMIIICEPEESWTYFDQILQNTVDFFLTIDIPVRLFESCSGDLADLKAKGIDVEAWSPRQNKYAGELGSCSNLTDAQSRRLKIRVKGDKENYLPHTLNNTVVAPPRMLIAYLENNYNEDGSVNIAKALQPYMGGLTRIEPKK